jgi:hypothetical protein
MSLRPLKQIVQPKPTIEGGSPTQPAFGFGKTKEFDPFSLAGRFPQRVGASLDRASTRGLPFTAPTKTPQSQEMSPCWRTRSLLR